jgi:hypothetical protein
MARPHAGVPGPILERCRVPRRCLCGASEPGLLPTSCEAKHSATLDWCLALVLEKLGRHADAQAQLTRVHESLGDAAAYQYTDTYAQWGDKGRALDWLETAMRLRDPGLVNVKLDPLIDPLRQEPRFQAIERVLKFPD